MFVELKLVTKLPNDAFHNDLPIVLLYTEDTIKQAGHFNLLITRSSQTRLFPITSPYRNWKDSIMDLKIHAACDYHDASMARLNAFKKTYINGSCRIDVTNTDANTKQVEQNRIILKSLVK